MDLSYIVDASGNRTAVIIPIADWKQLVLKYPDLKQMENPKPDDQRKLSDFAGTLPKEVAEQMLAHIKR